MIGLSTQTLSGEVKCDEQERVEWLSVILPANTTSETNQGNQEEQKTQTVISLRFIDHPPDIPKPNANYRLSAIEFINSSVEQAKKALSEENKKNETE